MNLEQIYEEVKKWTKENHGTKNWIWEDYFADAESGFENFKDNVEKDLRDGTINYGWSEEDIISHIEDTLNSNRGDCLLLQSHLGAIVHRDNLSEE